MKILIVNNNMQIGGIQKSLLNLLNSVHDDYDITLLLFSDYGVLLKDVPSNVNVVFADERTKVLGTPWNSLKKTPKMLFCKFYSKIICRLKGKDAALNFLFKKQRKITGFDAVISFSHCTPEKTLSIGTPEFVLNCTESDNKICFIHCDYIHSNTCSEHNNRIYSRFDRIACCSESVRKNFLQMIPELENRTFAVRNFYDMSIVEQAKDNPYCYDDNYVNLISVARLSEEKGILRAVKTLADANRKDIRYFVVGSGPQENEIKEYICRHNLQDNVFLLGEMKNPYRYMLNADYLLVPSYHEAAPMVFDEANILNLPVISTKTTSACEMLTKFDLIVEEFDNKSFHDIKKTAKTKFFDKDMSLLTKAFNDIIAKSV